MASIVLGDLLSSLPESVSTTRGLLDSVSSICLRGAGAAPALSASKLMLEAKRASAAAEASATPVVLTGVSPRISAPPNLLHEAIVAGHQANMADMKTQHSARAKSSKANKRSQRTSGKSEAYGERLSAKTGSRDERSARMNVFKKQY